MKIKLDIDCTPEEARAFFGLPDVAPMQEAVLEEVQKRMLRNLERLDPESLFRTWMPLTAKGLDDFRKIFTAAVDRRDDARDEPGRRPPGGSVR